MQNTNDKFICKDITKHPEYQKVLSIKDKKIQDRMIKCLQNKFKNGFDLRQFPQKFDKQNHTYEIVKYEIKKLKEPRNGKTEFTILYDKDGFKYYSKDKIDKYIQEHNVPNEIPESASFTINTDVENFFMKDGNPIFYIPIEPIYMNLDDNNEEILLNDA